MRWQAAKNGVRPIQRGERLRKQANRRERPVFGSRSSFRSFVDGERFHRSSGVPATSGRALLVKSDGWCAKGNRG